MVLRLRLACSLFLLLGARIGAKVSGTPAKPPQVKAEASAGLGFELDAKEADVLEIVKLVAGDSIVRGTYVYENNKTLTGALPADSSAYFGPWTGPGHAFYKVLKGAVPPRNFKVSADVGTIRVPYVVLPQGHMQTHSRVGPVFGADGHRKPELSDGEGESH